MKAEGTFHVAGTAQGPVLRLFAPLSFWGGVDAETGRILDRSQPEAGASLAGQVLVMPSGRGSSSSASVLAELIRNGNGPTAIVLRKADPIITAGAIVARSLYGISCPVVVCDIASIPASAVMEISISSDGGAVLKID